MVGETNARLFGQIKDILEKESKVRFDKMAKKKLRIFVDSLLSREEPDCQKSKQMFDVGCQTGNQAVDDEKNLKIKRAAFRTLTKIESQMNELSELVGNHLHDAN